MPERLFLLGRVGFLVTVEREGAVREMVDKEDVVESLVYVSVLEVVSDAVALVHVGVRSSRLCGSERAFEAHK
jgi:predicted transcriptional regulator